ncbi:hypothetical protein [Bryobacter aggregatus]|uniref:hypothetical protein n=1 Tax=Bryobacter aggregatus TaxID=360054 RepID=UPI0012BABD48|nr:hypothetical protein [Bryobacter aggregatus]
MSRPMIFNGREITVCVGSQFFIDREAHRGMGAFALLRKLFSGPQDLTLTDGAAEASAKVWEPAGGDIARLYAFNWIRALKPFATIQEHSIRRKSGTSWDALNGVIGFFGSAVDVLAQRAFPGGFSPSSPFQTLDVDANGLFDTITEIGWKEKLKPKYERESFTWLLQEAAAAPSGELRKKVVYDQTGKACGWFVYYLNPGGVCSVLQIYSRRTDQFRGVLRALFADAAQGGGACVKGQSQPKQLVDLTEEHCLFRQPNSSVLVQSRDTAITAAIHRGDAALSRLDGECWLRFAPEKW